MAIGARDLGLEQLTEARGVAKEELTGKLRSEVLDQLDEFIKNVGKKRTHD
jgi:hypothetical protein